MNTKLFKGILLTFVAMAGLALTTACLYPEGGRGRRDEGRRGEHREGGHEEHHDDHRGDDRH